MRFALCWELLTLAISTIQSTFCWQRAVVFGERAVGYTRPLEQYAYVPAYSSISKYILYILDNIYIQKYCIIRFIYHDSSKDDYY